MRRVGGLFPCGFLDDGMSESRSRIRVAVRRAAQSFSIPANRRSANRVRQSETVLGAVFSDSAMSLFIIPSAASKTILARNTRRAGVRLPRVQRLSVLRSSSVSVICRACFMGFVLRIRMKPRNRS